MTGVKNKLIRFVGNRSMSLHFDHGLYFLDQVDAILNYLLLFQKELIKIKLTSPTVEASRRTPTVSRCEVLLTFNNSRGVTNAKYKISEIYSKVFPSNNFIYFIVRIINSLQAKDIIKRSYLIMKDSITRQKNQVLQGVVVPYIGVATACVVPDHIKFLINERGIYDET